ncbi:hypothetical protein DTL42_18390 [Bremerella cremea]|uniref:Uncharacterized protein n=1 Tax=Bremerella cremea TaxID=1031537 RepID=A0A368KPX3_9BACT|nr:hypothetical protein DTL42_18390 [Bremerella cremea]
MRSLRSTSKESRKSASSHVCRWPLGLISQMISGSSTVPCSTCQISPVG